MKSGPPYATKSTLSPVHIASSFQNVMEWYTIFLRHISAQGKAIKNKEHNSVELQC